MRFWFIWFQFILELSVSSCPDLLQGPIACLEHEFDAFECTFITLISWMNPFHWLLLLHPSLILVPLCIMEPWWLHTTTILAMLWWSKFQIWRKTDLDYCCLLSCCLSCQEGIQILRHSLKKFPWWSSQDIYCMLLYLWQYCWQRCIRNVCTTYSMIICCICYIMSVILVLAFCQGNYTSSFVQAKSSQLCLCTFPKDSIPLQQTMFHNFIKIYMITTLLPIIGSKLLILLSLLATSQQTRLLHIYLL